MSDDKRTCAYCGNDHPVINIAITAVADDELLESVDLCADCAPICGLGEARDAARFVQTMREGDKS